MKGWDTTPTMDTTKEDIKNGADTIKVDIIKKIDTITLEDMAGAGETVGEEIEDMEEEDIEIEAMRKEEGMESREDGTSTTKIDNTMMDTEAQL